MRVLYNVCNRRAAPANRLNNGAASCPSAAAPPSTEQVAERRARANRYNYFIIGKSFRSKNIQFTLTGFPNSDELIIPKPGVAHNT